MKFEDTIGIDTERYMAFASEACLWHLDTRFSGPVLVDRYNYVHACVCVGSTVGHVHDQPENIKTNDD